MNTNEQTLQFLNLNMHYLHLLSYRAELELYKQWRAEDRKEFDEIIQAARDAGATEEMIKSLGDYEYQKTVYDDMAEWVSIFINQ